MFNSTVYFIFLWYLFSDDVFEGKLAVQNNNRNQASISHNQQGEGEGRNPQNNSRGQHWMSSLVSTFRSRKTHDKEESAKT